MRFLFATQPVTGHIVPALPLLRALVERGHEVVCYTGQKFQAPVEATGARFVAYREAYDFDDADYDAAFPARGALKGLDQLRFDISQVFIKQAVPQVHDLEAVLADWPANVVVGDPTLMAAVAVSERGGPPNATYGITCLGIGGREVAPFGLGLPPMGGLPGRLRNRALSFVASDVVFRKASDEVRQQCRVLGIAPRAFSGIVVSPYLFVQPSVTSFEYRRSDLPPQVHYVGALLPDAPESVSLPAWWDEVLQSRQPVVLVTQGTVATDAQQLLAPTLRALADQPVLVVAAGLRDPRAAGLDPLPANVRWAPFVPFKPLMPHVAAYVTNGGFGGVMFALANGVPMVVAGSTEDKPEIANRVAYCGVGVNLKTSTPTLEQVRAAVQRLLDEPAFRQRARAVQHDLAQHDAPREAADLLEQLAATKRPVLTRMSPSARASARTPETAAATV